MNVLKSILVAGALAGVMRQTQAAEPAADHALRQAERFLAQHDANKDGKLSRLEMPPGARQLFDRVDSNRNGFVEIQEDAAFRRARHPRIARDAKTPSAGALAEGFRAYRDLEYAKVGDKSLLLDVFTLEESDQRLPLIVWVHGGGWRAGDKRNCPALRLLEQGFVVASINYRLTDEAIFPAQIQDCKAAVRWLRAEAERFHVDRERIGVWGSSAGGHLVALLGTSGDVEELEGDLGNSEFSSRVQAVCDFFGPTDFLQMNANAIDGARLNHDAPDSPEAKLVGGPIQENPDKVARANPITYVTADDPPFLIVHGDQDPLVPLHQSELLTAALRKAEVPVQFHKVAGAGHGFRGRKGIEKMVDAFFRKQLQP